MSGDGKVRAAPESSLANAKLKIWSWPKVDLLSIKHGLALQSPADGSSKSRSRILRSNKMMSGQLAHPEFNPIGPQPAQEAGQLSGSSLVNAEHIHWLGIVAGPEWVFSRPKPQALLAK